MREQAGYTEEQLLEQFHNGTGDGYTVLFKEWYPAICYFADSILHNMTEAEDVAEDSFIKLWERRQQFISLQKCKSYLYSCARNASIDILRHRKIVSSGGKELNYLAADNANNFFDNIVAAEMAKELNDAMESLPPACRKICTMIYTEGKNSREVAEELQLSVSTVKTQKQRALSMIRKKLLIILPIIFLHFF